MLPGRRPATHRCWIVPPGSRAHPQAPRTLDCVFRSRSKDGQAADSGASAAEPQQHRDPEAPKGRPTPKRSEAEAQRRSLAKTPANRKEAAKRSREARRAQLAKQREALTTGDERYLPLRDRGPVRRYVRDYVDSKFSVAEWFLPIAVVILVLSMLPSAQARNISLLLWLGVIVMIVIDSTTTAILLRRRLRTEFPDENRRGATVYGLMRTVQMRRMRLPKPQIRRGEAPRVTRPR